MNKQTEALKMAIEALDTLMMEKGSIYQQALNACKEALAEAESEASSQPVAWWNGEYNQSVFAFKRDTPGMGLKNPKAKPLYTHPPTWQSLSNDELLDIANKSWEGISPHTDTMNFARAIEAKLKEKND